MSSSGECFELGTLRLSLGGTLHNARLVYRTYGTLAPDRSNLVLYPTSYGAQHPDIDWLVAEDGILDPTRYFVVIVNMFGNGLSSSASHYDGVPLSITHHDNVAAQERLIREVFGVERIALVYGWSMGAQQAYHWATAFPERVARVAALCGTARTTEHNLLFLKSLEAALLADPAWDGARFVGTPERGLRTFACIYASWAASQAFYREQIYRSQGYTGLDDYLTRGWEPNYRRRHPADLVTMLRTWMMSDVSARAGYDGDLDMALAAVRARTLVIASETDLYFPPVDCAADAKAIPGARFVAIPSIWGHRAGNPHQNPADARFIRRAVAELLAS